MEFEYDKRGRNSALIRKVLECGHYCGRLDDRNTRSGIWLYR